MNRATTRSIMVSTRITILWCPSEYAFSSGGGLDGPAHKKAFIDAGLILPAHARKIQGRGLYLESARIVYRVTQSRRKDSGRRLGTQFGPGEGTSLFKPSYSQVAEGSRTAPWYVQHTGHILFFLRFP